MKATKIAMPSLLRFCGGMLLFVLVACTPPGPAALLDGETLLNEGEYVAAIKKFRIATDLLGDNPEAWNFLGLAYHRSGQPEEAVKAYQQALRLNVDYLTARYNLGCLLLENEEFDAAVNQFKTYQILVEDDPKVSVKIGVAQLGAGRLNEAEKAFKAGLSHSRAFPEAWNGLGLIRLNRRLAKSAFDHFNTAIEQDANFAPAYLNQAIVAHHHLKKLPIALQKYRRFMFLEPDSPKMLDLKEITAEIEEAIRPRPVVVERIEEPQKPDEPLKEEAKAVEVAKIEENPAPPNSEGDVKEEELDPDAKSDAEMAAVLEAEKAILLEASIKQILQPDVVEGKVEESDKVLTTEVAKEERTFVAPAEIAKTERPVETVTFETIEVPTPQYNFAVGNDRPENASLQDLENGGWRTVSTRRSGLGISIGRQMFRNGDPSETGAQTLAAKVQRVSSIPYQYRNPMVPIAGDRRQADPFFQKGNQAFRSDRASEAILAYREAVSRDPAFFEAYFNMGLAAIKAGLTETALEAYEKALVIDQSNRNAKYNFALALEQGRHNTEAASELESILSSSPDDVHAHFTLATLYAKKIGNASLARSHYQRVLDLDPNYSKAVSIRYWLSASD
jgi:tetratricopeptide (TPR) repeat protein